MAGWIRVEEKPSDDVRHDARMAMWNRIGVILEELHSGRPGEFITDCLLVLGYQVTALLLTYQGIVGERDAHKALKAFYQCIDKALKNKELRR